MELETGYMEKTFDFDSTDDDLIKSLSGMEFHVIGQGSSAYVLGNAEGGMVLKIFPPLNVGTADELVFIRRNSVLRYADFLSAKWQNIYLIKWLRRKAKFILAVFQSSRNIEKRENSSDMCIRGYERCVKQGLMEGLPTRVIPNCCDRLSIKTSRVLRNYLVQPEKIVMQKRFNHDEILLYVIRHHAEKNDTARCVRLIEDAIQYQLHMWALGLISTDMSFNIFENLIVLPDGRLQLHDANDVVDSYSPAMWFIREKEKDLNEIFSGLDKGNYPGLLFRTSHSSISETARKLYNVLPDDIRDELVINFLNHSRQILSEDVFKQHWKGKSQTDC